MTFDVRYYLPTFIPNHKTQTSKFDPNNYHIIIDHKQDYLRKLSFIRAAQLWNSLSQNLKVLASFTVTLRAMFISI